MALVKELAAQDLIEDVPLKRQYAQSLDIVNALLINQEDQSVDQGNLQVEVLKRLLIIDKSVALVKELAAQDLIMDVPLKLQYVQSLDIVNVLLIYQEDQNVDQDFKL